MRRLNGRSQGFSIRVNLTVAKSLKLLIGQCGIQSLSLLANYQVLDESGHPITANQIY